MKHLFAYIRVSTAKQGQGVSLQEQRSAIERFTARTNAEIIKWFEERKTAAKTGRPEFTRMLKLLRSGKAAGVVIHKIDRSTRNYRDWAEIDELLESGIDVFFANEDVDLRSRGGRLAADIQMVVAVDYIRNLREEALKGIHGRLKQGILPHGAPIGYLDQGAGQPKAIDPERGPIIRRLFEEYATGRMTLRVLTADAERLGLRSRNGKPLTLTRIQKLLRNPFYNGILASKRHGVFRGAHEPLIKPATFDVVQQILDGKRVRRTKTFSFVFRRLIHCVSCGRSLVGSERKGFVYYRCQVPDCPTTSLREEAIDEEIREQLRTVMWSPTDAETIEHEIRRWFDDSAAIAASRRLAAEQSLTAINARLSRLTDLLLDAKIETAAHDEKRAALLMARARAEEALATVGGTTEDCKTRIELAIKVARTATTMYQQGNDEEKRELISLVFADCVANGKQITFSLQPPFASHAGLTRAPMSSSQGAPQLLAADALLKWAMGGSENLGLQTAA